MRKILLLCGVAVPVLYAVADVAAGLHFEGYSFRDQTISELGAIGASSRGLMVAILVPTYLCLTAFGVGVWQSADGRRRLRVAGGVVVGLGILALVVGMFVPMQPRGTEQGLAGALHLIEGGVWMLGLLVAMGFAAAALGRRFAVYTAATVVVLLVFGGWAGMAGARIEAGLPTPWLGVIERVFWYAYELWFAVLALRLLSERTQAARPSPAPLQNV
jgi:hypothetical protein